jgi:hypothetical protein
MDGPVEFIVFLQLSSLRGETLKVSSGTELAFLGLRTLEGCITYQLSHHLAHSTARGPTPNPLVPYFSSTSILASILGHRHSQLLESQFRSSVLAKNTITLANVGLASARLLPFPDRARPYIMSAQFPSHQASRPSRYASRIIALHAPTLSEIEANPKNVDRCLWVWLS